jgi:AbrB family transcriptional regulator (stage V sporulation protein T)
MAEGDQIGAVIIVSKEDVELGEVETKLVETAAAFLGKQMEQ